MIREFRDGGRGGFGGGRSGGFGGRGGGFGGGFSRGRDSGPREMFDATCSTCGKACQVPFRPTGNKPVLCSDCFGKSDGMGSRFGGSQSSISSEQFNQINAKLDKILTVLKELELDVDENEELTEEATSDLEEDEGEDSGSEKMGVVSTEDTDEEF